MGFQDLWWNISMSSLVILAASVFEIWCGKTDRQTNASENLPPFPATAVGLGNEKAFE